MSGRVLSGVTPASRGRSGKDLIREELADYISPLDICAADMSIVTGVDLPGQDPGRSSWATETARLIWDVRFLTADQVRQVRLGAKSHQ